MTDEQQIGDAGHEFDCSIRRDPLDDIEGWYAAWVEAVEEEAERRAKVREIVRAGLSEVVSKSGRDIWDTSKPSHRFAARRDRESFRWMFGDKLDEWFSPEFAAYVRNGDKNERHLPGCNPTGRAE